ncbi:hypothetical protein ACVWYH_006211 [Bradyrhizobium sp. GM24.11]
MSAAGRLMLSDIGHFSDVVALLLNSRPDLWTDTDDACFLFSPFANRSDTGQRRSLRDDQQLMLIVYVHVKHRRPFKIAQLSNPSTGVA